MKRIMFLLLALVTVFTSGITVFASNDESLEIVLLSPAAGQRDGFPILEEARQDQGVKALIGSSFMKKSLQIYGMAQKKYSRIKDEPFYLTFKPDSGEHGGIGFYLKKEGKLIDKTSSPYIELNTAELTSDPARLQSLTQIFPHEMGHVLIALTIPSMTSEKTGSLEMHNSDVVTDYSTAFNEGFAEHFEIISRENEENKELKRDIYRDIERTGRVMAALLPRAERDFTLPLRLDYYRAAAFLWISKAEGLKRDRLPMNGECIYKNSSRRFNDVEKTILYRNMGFGKDTSRKRSLQQCLSTESVISRFFFLLYRENPLPMLEHYSKILEVFSKYVGKDEKPPLVQFVRGYCLEYPGEKEKLLKIYHDAVGYDFSDEAIPELWMISRGRHIAIPMDQFGAASLPLYIFNINTCEIEDLLKLDGMRPDEAQKLLRHRERIKYFKTAEDFKSVGDIDSNTRSILDESVLGTGWTREEVEKALDEGDGQSRFNLQKLLLAHLKHLLLRILVLFAVFYAAYYFLALRGRGGCMGKGIVQFLKFLLYAFGGLASAVLSMAVTKDGTGVHPIVIFAIIIGVIELARLPFLAKNGRKLRDGLLSTFLMAGMIVYSLL